MDRNIVECNRHCELYVRDMDDIEMSANPRWDADFHDYATVMVWMYYCRLLLLVLLQPPV